MTTAADSNYQKKSLQNLDQRLYQLLQPTKLVWNGKSQSVYCEKHQVLLHAILFSLPLQNSLLSKIKFPETRKQEDSAVALIGQSTWKTGKYGNANSSRLLKQSQLNTITNPGRSSKMTIHNVVICSNS